MLNLAYLFFLLLSVLMLFVNQAPHNLSVALLSLFSIFYLYNNRKSAFRIFRTHQFFFTLLILYFLTYILINYLHFGPTSELEFALKRSRWIVYTLTICPALIIFLGRKKLFSKNEYHLTLIFSLAFFLILSLVTTDSISRMLYETPQIVTLLKSSTSKIFLDRAGWTYNPIPFSKMSFFSCLFLLGGFLTLKRNFQKITCAFFSTAMFIVTILTQTRASWLAILLLVAFGIVYFKKIRPIGIGITLASLFALVLVPNNFLIKRFKSIGDQTNISNMYRIEHLKANLKLSQDHFFIGAGYGSNRKPTVIDPYLHKFTEDIKLLYGHPHNEFIDVLSGMGFPSLILFIFLMFYPLFQGTQILIRKEKLNISEYNWLILSICFILFSYFTALFDKIATTTWILIIFSWTYILYLKHKERIQVPPYNKL